MRFPPVVCLFVCFTVLNISLLAQSPYGNINGLVSDPTGAAVMGAEVIAINDVTGVQYTTKSNTEGLYILPNLPPGPYRVQVSKVGFKTLVKPDLVVNVQDALSINFSLLVGAFHEIVTVEGGAPIADTENAAVSTVVDRQFAENLPLNGRSFQTLIDLTPGVSLTSSNQTDSGQFSVNGQRASSNYWMVDGVSANVGIGVSNPGNGFGGTLGAFSTLGGTNSLISVDAIQEFRIQTSTFSPEFGRTPGGQISIASRSGTNYFHGTAFDYLRNDLLDANNWFADSARLAKPRERQNDFGGTLGGPIWKDRTFFFLSYEGLRLRLPQTTLSNVPDLASRKNAVAGMQPYLDAYPLPNGDDTLASGIAQFKASYSDPAGLDAYSLKIDHKLKDKWNLFARYNFSPSTFVARGGSTGSSALSSLEPFQINTTTITGGANVTLSTAVEDDLRFNYSRVGAGAYFYLDDFGGAVPLARFGFPENFTTSNSRLALSIPPLGIGSVLQTGDLNRDEQHQINLINGLAWQKGSHTLKFGADFRRLSPLFAPFAYSQTAIFATVPAAVTGLTAAGRVASSRDVMLLFHNLGVYVQDTWRVTTRFTTTYGLRWDVDFPPSSANGPNIPAVVGYNLYNLSGLAVAPTGAAPFKTDFGDVAPRFGAAYEVVQNANWHTVLRGGAGLFYDLVSAEVGNQLTGGFPPFGNALALANVSFPFTPSQIAPIPIPDAATLSELTAFNPKLKAPYTIEWNVSIEQSLGKEQNVSASYVGSVGKRLLQTTQYSFPPSNPAIEFAQFVDNTAESNYNALQIKFQRRLYQGLQVLASYAWAHSIDDASASSFGNASNLGAAEMAASNRGNSDFDIRNAFTGGVTFDMPGPHRTKAVRSVFGNWSIESFVLAHSATPIDLSDANFYEFNQGVQVNIRPDVVPGAQPYFYGKQCAVSFQNLGQLSFGESCPGGEGLNPSAFTNPPTDSTTGNPLRQGDIGRNELRGFGIVQWDAGVHRDFRFGDVAKLQIRAELFNLLNHPSFGPPNNQFGTSGFGLSTSTFGEGLAGFGGVGGGAFNPLYQIGGPRSIQIAAKIMF